MNKIYDERLLKFAERLERLEEMDEPDIREGIIYHPEFHLKTWYSVTYNMNYFFELPIVFDEWIYNEKEDSVEIKSYPKYRGMLGAIRLYFKLHPREFTHLFDVEGGHQNRNVYGGMELHKNSAPQDIAYNIIQFVETRK